MFQLCLASVTNVLKKRTKMRRNGKGYLCYRNWKCQVQVGQGNEFSLHQVLISSSTVHLVLFCDCDNFSKKHEHQSNKRQQKLLFIYYLRIPRFMRLWFPQPYFSHTILISHNTVWSQVGFFKWMGRVCCTSLQNHVPEIYALLLHFMWRQFITPVWHATIFKKDFAFSFIKIAFPVLHHNIYFSLLLFYFQFWYISLLTQKQSLKEGNCNIIGLAGLHIFNNGNKDELKKTVYTYSNSV